MTPWELWSLRRGIGSIDDRLGLDRRIDHAELLPGRDLVGDVAVHQAAVAIDPTEALARLLGIKPGELANDTDEILGIRARRAMLERGVVIGGGAAIGFEEMLEHGAVLRRAGARGEDGAELPRDLVADPADDLAVAALFERLRRDRGERRGIDGAALYRGGDVVEGLQRQQLHPRQRKAVFLGELDHVVVERPAEGGETERLSGDVPGMLQAVRIGLVAGDDGGEIAA